MAVPASNSVDVGFAQDMSVHHNQAIEMSAMALGRSTDPVIRTLAFDVLTSQQSQVGTMQGWLTLWDRPYLPDGPTMTWMTGASSTGGHPMDMSASANDSGQDATSMPGMASTAELTALRRMNAEEFDGRYLQLLRRHHRGESRWQSREQRTRQFPLSPRSRARSPPRKPPRSVRSMSC